MGAELAAKIAPDRLTFPAGARSDGTLKVRVAPGLGPEIQHRAPLILERVNGFFGYRAVARLSLVQAPFAPPRPAASVPRPLSGAERDALDRRLAAIEDPRLRDALSRLGAAVIGSRRR